MEDELGSFSGTIHSLRVREDLMVEFTSEQYFFGNEGFTCQDVTVPSETIDAVIRIDEAKVQIFASIDCDEGGISWI